MIADIPTAIAILLLTLAVGSLRYQARLSGLRKHLATSGKLLIEHESVADKVSKRLENSLTLMMLKGNVAGFLTLFDFRTSVDILGDSFQPEVDQPKFENGMEEFFKQSHLNFI